MRILALMKYSRRAATTRQRLLQYEPYLNARGIEVDMSPLLDDRHLIRIAEGRGAQPFFTAWAYLRRVFVLLRARRYDLIWVHCELFPYLPGVIEQLPRLLRRPMIFDYDDAIFHMYDAHPRRLVRRLLGSKLAPLLRQATVCLCGNAYLRDYAQRYCRDSIVLPTVVDTDAYRPGAPRDPAAPTIVGWIGSPSTWAYVQPLLQTLLPLLKRHGARLRVVGAGPAANGIEGVDNVEWSEAEEIGEVQGMDIGIMPLPDKPWAWGKCGYKLIQYMACGLPVVASPVGVNREIVTDGENGFLVVNDGWLEALGRLLGDPDLRDRMGRNGRIRVEECYSLRSQQDRLVEALWRAAADARPGQEIKSAADLDDGRGGSS